MLKGKTRKCQPCLCVAAERKSGVNGPGAQSKCRETMNAPSKRSVMQQSSECKERQMDEEDNCVVQRAAQVRSILLQMEQILRRATQARYFRKVEAGRVQCAGQGCAVKVVGLHACL